MAGSIPKISNCPIRDKETGKCMCMVGMCDELIHTNEECASVRCAYAYGYTVAETKLTVYMDKIKETIDALFAAMKKDIEDGDALNEHPD